MYDWIIANLPLWLILAFVIHLSVLGAVAYLILLERKIASWAQDRIGPNRTGLGFGIIPFLKNWKMFGLGQPLADGLKFILKEDYRPKNVDKILFTVAPMLMMVVVVVSIAVIPWGGIHQRTFTVDVTGAKDPVAQAKSSWALLGAQTREVKDKDGKVIRTEPDVDVVLTSVPQVKDSMGIITQNASTSAAVTYKYAFQIANINIGVLFVLATLSLAVYGVVIGGWASNNKYSFLGGLRATANMISYEIPLSLCVLSIVILFGTLDLGKIVEYQAHTWFGFIPAWNIFTQPLAFFLFLVCIHAEANRAPFDLAEAEQELVGGYHTEYSSMRFALFFLAEYAGMITTSAVCVALFFGGWHLPYITDGNVDANHMVTSSMGMCILRALIYFAKVVGIIAVFMWTRWSLPRFRFDQLMGLAWRGLIPVTLAMVMINAFVVYYYKGESFTGMGRGMTITLIVTNVALWFATMIVSQILPKPLPTNRKIVVPGSRFNKPVASPANA